MTANIDTGMISRTDARTTSRRHEERLRIAEAIVARHQVLALTGDPRAAGRLACAMAILQAVQARSAATGRAGRPIDDDGERETVLAAA